MTLINANIPVSSYFSLQPLWTLAFLGMILNIKATCIMILFPKDNSSCYLLGTHQSLIMLMQRVEICFLKLKSTIKCVRFGNWNCNWLEIFESLGKLGHALLVFVSSVVRAKEF